MRHLHHPADGPATARALHHLTTALRGYGLHTRLDIAARTVDVTTLGLAPDGPDRPVAHRLLLRPHGDAPWWWLLWPPPASGDGHRPDLEPLAPMPATTDVARRVYRTLVLTAP